MRRMVEMQYERNDMNVVRGKFRLRGDSLTILPSYEELAVRVDFFGDEVERIVELDPLTGEILSEKDEIDIFPAKHFVTTKDRIVSGVEDIEQELEEQVEYFKSQGKILEAARLEERTHYDIESMRETGYCSGIENYSRHLQAREPGSQPWSLLDYFPDDWLLDRRRVAHHAAAGAGHVLRRPRPQGHAGRLRLPPAQRDGQPAADLRRVHGPHQPGRLRQRDAGRLRDPELDARWSSR